MQFWSTSWCLAIGAGSGTTQGIAAGKHLHLSIYWGFMEVACDWWTSTGHVLEIRWCRSTQNNSSFLLLCFLSKIRAAFVNGNIFCVHAEDFLIHDGEHAPYVAHTLLYSIVHLPRPAACRSAVFTTGHFLAEKGAIPLSLNKFRTEIDILKSCYIPFWRREAERALINGININDLQRSLQPKPGWDSVI